MSFTYTEEKKYQCFTIPDMKKKGTAADIRTHEYYIMEICTSSQAYILLCGEHSSAKKESLPAFPFDEYIFSLATPMPLCLCVC